MYAVLTSKERVQDSKRGGEKVGVMLRGLTTTTKTYLENQSFKRLLIVLLSTEILDFLACILKQCVELIISRFQDGDSRVVQCGRLSTIPVSHPPSASYRVEDVHLPSDFGLLSLLLVLGVDGQRLLPDDLCL